MAGLDPDISFTPAISQKFGAENVIVVKDALRRATNTAVVQGLDTQGKR